MTPFRHTLCSRLGKRIADEIRHNQYMERVKLDVVSATTTPCAQTINLNQTYPTSTINVTHANTNGSTCWWAVESPPNTQIIIEFSVFRLEAYNELFIYDSTERLLLSVDADNHMNLSLNPVISDSYAHLEFRPSQSSLEYFLSIETHFTGNLNS